MTIYNLFLKPPHKHKLCKSKIHLLVFIHSLGTILVD